MNSHFRSNTPRGSYTNTRESLLATLTALPVTVPEPGVLSLLWAGLLAACPALRRRRGAATQPGARQQRISG